MQTAFGIVVRHFAWRALTKLTRRQGSAGACVAGSSLSNAIAHSPQLAIRHLAFHAVKRAHLFNVSIENVRICAVVYNAASASRLTTDGGRRRELRLVFDLQTWP